MPGGRGQGAAIELDVVECVVGGNATVGYHTASVNDQRGGGDGSMVRSQHVAGVELQRAAVVDGDGACVRAAAEDSDSGTIGGSRANECARVNDDVARKSVGSGEGERVRTEAAERKVTCTGDHSGIRACGGLIDGEGAARLGVDGGGVSAAEGWGNRAAQCASRSIHGGGEVEDGGGSGGCSVVVVYGESAGGCAERSSCSNCKGSLVEDRSPGIGVGTERSSAGQGKGAGAALDKSDVGSTAAQESPIISTCAAVDREDGQGAAGVEDSIIPQRPRNDAGETGEGLVFPVHIQSDKATGSGTGIAINRQHRSRRQCIGDAESQLDTCVGCSAIQRGIARIGACPIEDKGCWVGVAARRVLENQTAGSAHRTEGEVG